MLRSAGSVVDRAVEGFPKIVKHCAGRDDPVAIPDLGVDREDASVLRGAQVSPGIAAHYLLGRTLCGTICEHRVDAVAFGEVRVELVSWMRLLSLTWRTLNTGIDEDRSGKCLRSHHADLVFAE